MISRKVLTCFNHPFGGAGYRNHHLPSTVPFASPRCSGGLAVIATHQWIGLQHWIKWTSKLARCLWHLGRKSWALWSPCRIMTLLTKWYMKWLIIWDLWWETWNRVIDFFFRIAQSFFVLWCVVCVCEMIFPHTAKPTGGVVMEFRLPKDLQLEMPFSLQVPLLLDFWVKNKVSKQHQTDTQMIQDDLRSWSKIIQDLVGSSALNSPDLEGLW